ncbi:MAG TPA: hypothetical protein VLT45_04525 [Kofleriaceae bacterium]|nr:hypothetical protein [Kofleriaceae bacterium]
MTYDDYCTEREVIGAEIDRGYREHSDEILAAATKRQHELIAKVERFYPLGDRGFVHVAFGTLGPGAVHVHLKDDTRFQETSYSEAEWNVVEMKKGIDLETARRVAADLALWRFGKLEAMPAGCSREDAYLPWKGAR